MNVLAHFGKIPVEEWLPFVVPLVALYIYGRRRERRRRAAVGGLPAAHEQLSEDAMSHVEHEWAAADHADVARRHLPLLVPPGPDGFSTVELAERIHADPVTVAQLLEELEELDYLTMDEAEKLEDRPVSLTFRGYELLDTTEVALLGALEARSAPDHPATR